MSMLSMQIDALRRVAQTYRDFGKYEAERMALDAADTIWELRDDLQQENAENARLRERITTQKQTIQSYRDESREWREVAERAQAENAKLRELVSELWEGYMDPPCEECQLKDTPTCVDCPICAREAAVIDRMRELGVEVPE